MSYVLMATLCGGLVGCIVMGLVTLARRWSGRRHRHKWELVGYGGAGWHAYRCACGEREIG